MMGRNGIRPEVLPLGRQCSWHAHELSCMCIQYGRAVQIGRPDETATCTAFQLIARRVPRRENDDCRSCTNSLPQIGAQPYCAGDGPMWGSAKAVAFRWLGGYCAQDIEKRGKNAKGNDTIPREIGRDKAHGRSIGPNCCTRGVLYFSVMHQKRAKSRVVISANPLRLSPRCRAGSQPPNTTETDVRSSRGRHTDDPIELECAFNISEVPH
jgi:hypothetical protein